MSARMFDRVARRASLQTLAAGFAALAIGSGAEAKKNKSKKKCKKAKKALQACEDERNQCLADQQACEQQLQPCLAAVDDACADDGVCIDQGEACCQLLAQCDPGATACLFGLPIVP